jgi:hypothetical protein
MNLGVPSWGELTAHMAERLGADPGEFARLGDYQTLAEFYALEAGSLDALGNWMDAEWHRDAAEKVRGSDIHRLIVELAFPVIYTTNYDRYLELAHEAAGVPYARVSDVAGVARARPGVTQIVKYHGDFEDGGSIVLTESSHFRRLSLEGPLDLKLRADLLGRVALFIGYSVSDVGVRYLLYRLHKLWEDAPRAADRPKAYVYLGPPNPVQARVLSSWGIVPLFTEGDVGEGLREFLENLLREVRAQPPADPKAKAARPKRKPAGQSGHGP